MSRVKYNSTGRTNILINFSMRKPLSHCTFSRTHITVYGLIVLPFFAVNSIICL